VPVVNPEMFVAAAAAGAFNQTSSEEGNSGSGSDSGSGNSNSNSRSGSSIGIDMLNQSGSASSSDCGSGDDEEAEKCKPSAKVKKTTATTTATSSSDEGGNTTEESDNSGKSPLTPPSVEETPICWDAPATLTDKEQTALTNKFKPFTIGVPKKAERVNSLCLSETPLKHSDTKESCSLETFESLVSSASSTTTESPVTPHLQLPVQQQQQVVR
jgi:hypothetical protein